MIHKLLLLLTSVLFFAINPSCEASGDFDGDGDMTVADIDLLSIGLRGGTTNLLFDVNFDGQVDLMDRQTWIFDLKMTGYGDANLDLRFDTTDFVVVFQAGQYEDDVTGNSNWQQGDWNGDGDFTSDDFVQAFSSTNSLCFENGCHSPRFAVPLPEPVYLNSTLFAVIVCIAAVRLRGVGRRP